jgi:predicted MPP superfamily phosphohydrolase
VSGPEPTLLAAWCGAVLGPVLAVLLWLRLSPAWRRSLRFRIGLALFLLSYGLAVWGFLVEPATLVVRRVSVTSPTWRGPPLRIGILSDVHVGAHVSPERVRRVVARLSRERPQVIVYLGDYAGGHEPAQVRRSPARSAILRGVAALGRASAPLGRIAILGNHDWWYDGPAIESRLRTSGITVLENDAVRIGRAGAPFWIAGLADLDSQRAQPSAELALRNVPGDEPVMLLTHWPDPFPTVPDRVALTWPATPIAAR